MVFTKCMYVCMSRWKENYSIYFHQIRDKHINLTSIDAVRLHHRVFRRVSEAACRAECNKVVGRAEIGYPCVLVLIFISLTITEKLMLQLEITKTDFVVYVTKFVPVPGTVYLRFINSLCFL